MSRKQTIKHLIDDLVAVRRASMAKRITEHTDLTTGQKELLYELHQQGKPTGINEIARSLDVSPSAITQQIDELVEKDLVTRTHSTDDRRVVEAQLTAKGQRQANQAMDTAIDRFLKLFEPLNDRELETYARLLKKLAVSVREKRNLNNKE